MERIDGFLCIDNCKKELAREHHTKTNHYWIYINGEEYYFKPTNNYYNELIGYHAATILDIEACFCDIAILDGQKGIISKSLRKENIKLTSGSQILNDYAYDSISNLYWIKKMMNQSDISKKWWFNDKYRERSELVINGIHDLENIWHALEHKYKDDKRFNSEETMHQIIMMYIFTLLSYDTDKYAINWLIEESKENIKLAPLFDNEDSFNYNKDKLNQNVRLAVSPTSETYYHSQLEAINSFLSISSSEYFNLFYEMYEKLINNFDKIIRKIENQTGAAIPPYKKLIIVNGFYKNMEQIKKCLENQKNKFKTK